MQANITREEAIRLTSFPPDACDDTCQIGTWFVRDGTVMIVRALWDTECVEVAALPCGQDA